MEKNLDQAGTIAVPSTLKQKATRFIVRHGLLTGFVGAMVVGLVGCSISGGGWIQSLSGKSGDKATFGILASYDEIIDVLSGDVTFHDNYYKSSAFKKGVNLHSIPGQIILSPFNLLNVGPNGFDGVYVAGNCTFAQGGNAGVPGSFVAFASDTGEGGPRKGDTATFVVYPYAVADVNEAEYLGLQTYIELMGYEAPNLILDQIYLNGSKLGNGGKGGGNITVDGFTYALGGSPVSMAVAGTLAAAAFLVRFRTNRRA